MRPLVVEGGGQSMGYLFDGSVFFLFWGTVDVLDLGERLAGRAPVDWIVATSAWISSNVFCSRAIINSKAEPR